MSSLKLTSAETAPLAPPWSVAEWMNSAEPLALSGLRGRVVVLHAFQMLCPGCVAHGIPQAQRIQALFAPEDVCVVGLHTVFEHHDAMGPVSLAAFLHEYRVTFPVGVDEAGVGSPIPKTMAAYQMRGTPTLVLIDRSGRLRLHAFGRPDDMSVGAAISSLVGEGPGVRDSDPKSHLLEREGDPMTSGCDAKGCAIP